METETNNKEDIGEILWGFGLINVGGFATLILTFWWKGVIGGTEAKVIVVGSYSVALFLVVLGVSLGLFKRFRKSEK